jgi:hypothetical protein
MFSIFCPDLDHEVLLSTRRVTAITNTHRGTVVEFACVCGADGVYVTGASAPSSGLVYHQHTRQLAEAS